MCHTGRTPTSGWQGETEKLQATLQKKKVSESLIIRDLLLKKRAKKTSPQNLSRRTLMSCLKIHANVGIRRYHINLLF